MSLTMLLRNSEGLVMAADSRVTVGYTLKGPETRDDSVKFIRLNNDAGVMTHGIYDIGTAGLNALKSGLSGNSENFTPLEKTNDKVGGIDCEANGGLMPPLRISPVSGRSSLTGFTMSGLIKSAETIFRRADSDWTEKSPAIKRRERDTGFILAGFDREKTKFEVCVFESPDFTPKRIKGSFFLAGQWHIAKFLLNKLNAETIPINTLKKLAGLLLTATSSVDKTVGGPVRIAAITEEKGFQWASDDETKNISDFNDSFSAFFHELLQSSITAVPNK